MNCLVVGMTLLLLPAFSTAAPTPPPAKQRLVWGPDKSVAFVTDRDESVEQFFARNRILIGGAVGDPAEFTAWLRGQRKDHSWNGAHATANYVGEGRAGTFGGKLVAPVPDEATADLLVDAVKAEEVVAAGKEEFRGARYSILFRTDTPHTGELRVVGIATERPRFRHFWPSPGAITDPNDPVARAFGKLRILDLMYAPDVAASKLLAEATAARATWLANTFYGYAADAEVTHEGKTNRGTVIVSSRRIGVHNTLTESLQVSLFEALFGTYFVKSDKLPDPAGRWTTDILRCAAATRLTHHHEGATFANDVETHPLGRLISLHTRSHVRVKDKRVTTAEFTTTRGFTDAPEFQCGVVFQYPDTGALPSGWTYAESARKEIGPPRDMPQFLTETRTETVSITWTKVGGFDLPATVTTVQMQPGHPASTVKLSNHRLLDRDLK